MTTTLRTVVRRLPRNPNAPLLGINEPWLAVAWTENEPGTPDFEHYDASWAATHYEAICAAHKMRARLDAELMDQVHASRASRRAARSCECYTPGDLHTTGCPALNREPA